MSRSFRSSRMPRIAAITSVASLALLATACGGKAKPDGAGAAGGSPEQPVTVTYWSSSAGPSRRRTRSTRRIRTSR